MKIAFLGTGLMGKPMVERLLSAQITVMAYNRTPEKLVSLETVGATITTSPEEAIKNADCLILMLTNAPAIREVILSEKTRGLLSGKTIIQMGTISPSDSREIHQEITAEGGEYLEAPVLGSIPEAKTGTLLVMVGSTEEQFKKWLTLLQKFGSEPIYIGSVGTAAATKLALNQLIASLTTSFALSLSLVQKQGVDLEKFMNILRQSALYAPTFDKKLLRMCERDYSQPNFPTKHLLKDVDLFLKQALENNLNVSSLEGVREVIQKTIDLGLSEADYSALFSAINPED